MSERLLFPCTHAHDDHERATMPFIAAATAAVSGHHAVVVCTIEGVRLGVHGGADGIESDGLPAVRDLMDQLIASGGEIWLCSACTTKRGITGDDVIDGARIVGAATIVEALATGKALTLG